MASAADTAASRAARFTEQTRSMFRAILAENGIADTDDAILQQEMVMFFKLTRSHRIKLGRPGDFADCPLSIDDDDGGEDINDTVMKSAVPPLPQSPESPPPTSRRSSLSSPLSSAPTSPPTSPSSPPAPPPTRSRISSRQSNPDGSDNVVSYAGMDGPNKRKRKRRSSEAQSEDSRCKSPSVVPSIEGLGPAGAVDESRQPVEILAQGSLSQSPAMAVDGRAAPEDGSPATSTLDVTDALDVPGPISQTAHFLEGRLLEILRSEDAVDIMTAVLLKVAKIRVQVGRFGLQNITIGTTTDTAEIRKYTEQNLAALPFKIATEKITKTGAGCVGIGLQKAWEEAFYWDIIKRHAETIDIMSLPATERPAAGTRGPDGGTTQLEKAAAAEFIALVGLGTSDENQRKCRLWWMDLWEMKNAGVVTILLYRDAKFNKYCKSFPRRKHSPRELIDTIVSWENVYSGYIRQIELRALEQAKGNFSGRLDLLHASVAEILSIPESAWDNGSNTWYSDEEEASCKLTSSCMATSTMSNPKRLTEDAYIESGTNKSFFVSLRPGADKLVSVFPIVPVSPGDLLGIFSGKIRFSEHCDVAQAIEGPIPNLWLDYSQVTGTLNQMQVAQPGGKANVHLAWEGVNENAEVGPCESWRVLALAIRKIMPFEPLIRAAPSEKQFALHQSLDYARRGFLEEPL